MKKYLTIFLCISAFLMSCQEDENNELFLQPLPATYTGIDFNNTVIDNDSFNIVEYLYFYNGGGVSIGDINNDNLPDIYFTSNQGSDKLYLNKGQLQFEDVTTSSGISTDNGWSSGVTMADVNNDGWMDIYVCRLGDYKMYDDKNRLYINQGNDTFTEEAAQYGIDFSGFSTHAAFFDYDQDGDLDLYLLNHSVKNPAQFADATKTRYIDDELAGDRLLRNEEGRFVDVTQESGIYSTGVAFGLGLAIADFNNDHWLDIYVGNDFHENDYLYLNQGNGTFKEVIKQAVGHTSNFTMGVDAGDIDGDGRLDVLTLDMQPDDELAYKNSGGWETYEIYKFKRTYDYHHQSPKNALQLNRSTIDGIPRFTDWAGYFGIMATDWSWSPLIADFDLDGDEDVVITNGIMRRPNDLDYLNIMADELTRENADVLQMLESMPSGRVRNRLFLNNGKEKAFQQIQMTDAGYTTGAASGDLDNDGDLDLVFNHINATASIIENQTDPARFLKVSANPLSRVPGTQFLLYQKQKTQLKTAKPVSGFQSTSDRNVVFGIGDNPVDSLVIYWPDGKKQIVTNISSNTLEVNYQEANLRNIEEREGDQQQLDTIDFVHQESNFNDQSKDFLTPYFLSTYGPKVAVGNEYVYICGGNEQDGILLDKNFNPTGQEINKGISREQVEENNAVFADIDGDGDEDLFLCIGGYEVNETNPLLQDLVFFNNDGVFEINRAFSPQVFQNSTVATSSDYDKDGDTDLFVGVLGRTGEYGYSMPSYLLRNEGNRFSPVMVGIVEMVYDAAWEDLDGNGYDDLIVAGHWMPITILYNEDGNFKKLEIPDSKGLWFDIEVVDIDKDGNKDIVAGNFGLNHRFRATTEEPLELILNDFDRNGKTDPILTYYDQGKKYPYPNLELFLKQLPHKKKAFVFNADFSGKAVTEIFSQKELEGATIKQVETLHSKVFFQQNKTNWKAEELPADLQVSPVTAIATNEQGEYVFGGNFYEIDPNWGRQDALLMAEYIYRDGDWQFISSYPEIDGQIRDIKKADNGWVISRNQQKPLVIRK